MPDLGLWIAQIPALLAALGVLLIPGLPAAWLAGLRGTLLVAGSGGISLAIVALAALVAPVAGLSWSPLPVVIIASLVTVSVAIVRWYTRSAPPRPIGRSRPLVWASLVVTVLLWSGLVAFGIGSPVHPAQHFDVMFHLNAAAYVLEHGSASPFDMTMATPSLAHSFYPTLWHAVVTLVVPAAGGVVAATNIVTIAVVAVVWPASVLFLTECVWPGRVRAAVAAPLLSLGFAIFPLGFLNWGALYPNLLGNALIPVVLGFAVLATKRDGRPVAQQVLIGVAFVAAAGATALAHPSSLLAALVLGVPLAVQRVVAVWRSEGASRLMRVVVTVAVAVGTLVLIALLPILNVTTNEWFPYESLAQAAGEAIALGPVGRPASLLVALLAVVGAVAAIRRREGWWLVGSQLLAIGFFLVAAWFPVLPLRSALIGAWYDDVVRLAALLAVAALPLAARGADALIGWAVQSWRSRERPAAVVQLALVTVIVLACAIATLAVPRHEVRAMRSTSFLATEQSQGLSPDEAALLEEAGRLLPDDAVVVGDPLTGAGLLYAFTGRQVVFPHIKGRYGADAALLGTSLREGGAEVCAAAERLGVEYAIDFGGRIIFPGYQELYAGLHDLDESPILTPIANVGSAALYRITGCGP